MFAWMSSPEIWTALIALTVLEVVLGIDNIVFISILSDKLPKEQRPLARKLGLMLALVLRVIFLFFVDWITTLTGTLIEVIGNEISGRDMILLAGGLFLLAKATYEIHDKLEGPGGGDEEDDLSFVPSSFIGVLGQIALLDAVFSIDSVITAVGMTDYFGVMVAAVVIAILFMILSVDAVSRFINRRPTVKILALSFLILIGVNLIAEGLGQHIPKGYIYFAMAFSVFVEVLNLQIRGRKKPVKLKQPESTEESSGDS